METTKTYPSAQEMKYFTWEYPCSLRNSVDKLVEKGIFKFPKGDNPIEDPKEYDAYIKNNYAKVDEDGGSYEHCVCLNLKTNEIIYTLEWDYDDVRVDDNPFRYMSIDYNGDAFRTWWDLVYRKSYEAHQRIEQKLAEAKAKEPKVGDKAIVVKGRKYPKGMTGIVTKIWYFQASYYNRIPYALLDGEKKIALNNLEKCND